MSPWSEEWQFVWFLLQRGSPSFSIKNTSPRVTDQVPQKPTGMQEVYWGVLWGTTPVGEWSKLYLGFILSQQKPHWTPRTLLSWADPVDLSKTKPRGRTLSPPCQSPGADCPQEALRWLSSSEGNFWEVLLSHELGNELEAGAEAGAARIWA